ncbi:hypothetical protein CONLIGDRAFT_634905 [Coniochaeta ligniaria NRRL 30616]|uniref:Prion-inhibition and propagation HeLo domain-containing protein n=1 Tax=Coniochaeta ligniaria NRRL 30616 TaxID=1408157 RepID=A0A1J7JGD5_9PEZI|nr:hypothetical protein CONLIGDRAFT_634905 [Coniochaeta ligniaria NRRL 30616]
MADPLGATLSIIGLAGTCIELLKYGYIALDRKDEVQSLRGQLDLQALLLRRWAENVFLVPANGTETARVIPKEYCDIIRANLERLAELFSVGGGLVRTYTGDLLPLTVLDPSPETLKRKGLFQWIDRHKVKRPSAIKWAIRDAARLARLLQHATSIRTALVELVPPDMERLKLQILIDTLSETTTRDAAAVMATAIAGLGEQSPADAPVMQTISASLLLRQQLPQWLSQLDAAKVSAKALFIQDAEFACGREHIPQDLARWMTRLSSPSHGLESEEVLVEWRLCEANEDPGQFEHDILMLSNLLSCMSNHPDTRLPRCHGYIKSRSAIGLRFGLVLGVLPLPSPQAAVGPSTSSQIQPQSAYTYTPLNECITAQPYPLPDLSLRIRIALQLSRSLFHLLSAGVLHKAIRSDSIMCRSHSSGSHLDSPDFIVCGFEFARLDMPGQISRHAHDRNDAADLYRHPKATSRMWETRGYKDKGYLAVYDIYGLGVVLAELGLWRDIYELFVKASKKDPGSWTDDRFPGLLKRRVGLELGGMAGGRYAGVVRWCLEVGDVSEGRTTAELLMEYEEKVVKPLMECCV